MGAEDEDVTGLLHRWGEGDRDALRQLMPLVYEELKSIAARYRAGERQGHTLQTTEIIHEAYLRLAKTDQVCWQNRAHFFSIAARLIRNILVDHARRQQAVKRGRRPAKANLDQVALMGSGPDPELVALDISLAKLEELDPQKAKIVELRHFGGLEIEEIAAALAISPATVKRHWTIARAWLYRDLEGGQTP